MQAKEMNLTTEDTGGKYSKNSVNSLVSVKSKIIPIKKNSLCKRKDGDNVLTC